MNNNSQAANQLINEKSPYLLQHAYNPVNWFPWSDEIFKKAKAEDKLIFLSIGYSTCHWCHVFAHESFEDFEVAEILNRNFYSIKVDREERPDIDSIYMSVCVETTGSGGWPLSIFIDADKNPIYAGTYFPKRVFINLLEKIHYLWKNDRDMLKEYSQQVLERIIRNEKNTEDIDYNVSQETYRMLELNYDTEFGGFSSAPKFPMPSNLLFLLKYHLCINNPLALQMVTSTLDHLRNGGIYDQIGFGFCRYSTDRKWLVPHFEKMLYDNVLLMIVYSECYRIVRDNKYLLVAEEIAEYLERTMLSLEGGFYTAEDADSEGEEGKFYIFNPLEVHEVLQEDSEYFCRIYDITKNGNFQGFSIPNLINTDWNDADKSLLEKCRNRLFLYRSKRVHPLLDDKILSSYNGLAIAAFAILGRVTDNQKYLNISENAADFVKRKLYSNHKLFARYREGESKYLGYDEDYAYMIFGLLELYQSTLKKEYFDFALELNETFITHFYDTEHGGFYQKDKDGEVILFRKKEIYDGVTPSANSVQINNLYRIAGITQNEYYREIANRSMKCFMKEIKQYPAGYPFFAMNILYSLYGGSDIKLAAESADSVADMRKAIASSLIPFITVTLEPDENRYPRMEGKRAAYICKDFHCLSPITDIAILYENLKA